MTEKVSTYTCTHDLTESKHEVKNWMTLLKVQISGCLFTVLILLLEEGMTSGCKCLIVNGVKKKREQCIMCMYNLRIVNSHYTFVVFVSGNLGSRT